MARPFQFRLRTIFWLVALVAVLCVAVPHAPAKYVAVTGTLILWSTLLAYWLLERLFERNRPPQRDELEND